MPFITWSRDYNDYQMGDSNHCRECDSCGDFTIPMFEPYWKNTCKECWKRKNSTPSGGVRRCENCDCRLLKSSPAWKKLCLDCWKIGKPNYSKKKVKKQPKADDILGKGKCAI